MNIIIWLVIGGLSGWTVSLLMDTHSRLGIILNVVVGTVGAAFGGRMIGAASPINQGSLSIIGLMVSVLGAVLLIAVIRLFRSATARPVNVSMISHERKDESSERNINSGYRASGGRIITNGRKRG
jgi:uncharacterized membrane protein YeaQ/YmgE (transglycosylase-associated protein family)